MLTICPNQKLPQNGPAYSICRVKLGDPYLTFCSIYCSLTQPFGIGELEDLCDQLPGVIVEDFNTHQYNWGAVRCNDGGERLADFLLNSNLSLLNDGSAILVSDAMSTSPVLDLAFVEPTLLLDKSWSTYGDTLDSDNFLVSSLSS